MGYSYDFKDNTLYGADDINAIRSTIASKGVIPESSGACLVMYSGDSLMVCKGQALFADGSRIEIDDEGVTLTPTAEAKNYVYLFNDATKNENSVQISTSAPAGGSDYVPLAEIDESGNITDTRVFSELKMNYSQRTAAGFKQTVTFTPWSNIGDIAAEINLPMHNPSFIKFSRYSGMRGSGIIAFIPFDNSTFTMGDGMGLTGAMYFAVWNNDLCKFYLELSGNKLMFRAAEVCSETTTITHDISGYCLK